MYIFTLCLENRNGLKDTFTTTYIIHMYTFMMTSSQFTVVYSCNCNIYRLNLIVTKTNYINVTTGVLNFELYYVYTITNNQIVAYYIRLKYNFKHYFKSFFNHYLR